ncbi:MAG: DUF362 domain-containing protein [Promethearchaeota archaeon]
MNENSKINSTDVSITKNDSPTKIINNGIELLGGISRFIGKEDKVFIKINLRAPNGFPVNVNMDSLRSLIILCKEAGAKKIYVGGFPDYGVKTSTLNDTLGLKSYLDNLGVELISLDDPETSHFSSIEVNGKNIEYPTRVLESDKLIILNQLSVDPLFKCTLSLLNCYSLVSFKSQKIEKIIRSGKDYLLLDQYKQDLISNILNVFSIKKPCLVINDMFYFLEGAGPLIFKDSNLIRTGLVVTGSDAIAVDLITLNLLQIELLSSDILLEARDKRLGITDLSKINLKGEKLDANKLTVNFSVDKLNEITINNTYLQTGRICSGCFKEAYNLLNFMKTHMTKDLKYIKNQSMLIGENPLEPETVENVIVFGDCAVRTTKNRDFRHIQVLKKDDIIKTVGDKVKKEKSPQKKPIVKDKVNKSVIELPGCPPDMYTSLNSILKYYGKKQAPNLSFYNALLNQFIDKESKKPSKKRGVINDV